MDDIITGVFGKLPAHGDFVHRNLPSEFVTVWDEWLQHYITGSQEEIGEDWLNLYLTSPVWRFIFSEGTVDESAWSGIVLPSVDKIGRYFPFSVITKLPSNINPLEFMLGKNKWLDQIEALSLEALVGNITIDNLMKSIDAVEINYTTLYTKSENITENHPFVINLDSEEKSSSISTYILDAVLQKSYSSYSAWTTQGSEKVMPVSFYSQGLPSISGISTLISGQWQEGNWQQPYRLNNE